MRDNDKNLKSPGRTPSPEQREWASEDQDARAALREATKQEGWFDEYFITRVIERLDGQGYRITKTTPASTTSEGSSAQT